jgi:hypothetical protein
MIRLHGNHSPKPIPLTDQFHDGNVFRDPDNRCALRLDAGTETAPLFHIFPVIFMFLDDCCDFVAHRYAEIFGRNLEKFGHPQSDKKMKKSVSNNSIIQ